MKVDLSRKSVEIHLKNYIEYLFSLPEISCVKIRNIAITRDGSLSHKVKDAIDLSYHDSYSDVDLVAVISLASGSRVTPKEYVSHPERLGIIEEKILGYYFVPENNMYRIVFKNGIRYDLALEFYIVEGTESIDLAVERTKRGNPNWPKENINRFWFVQIQALGKLYRKDYLISCHLANLNLNETLVQQMVLRDLEYGTKHHRYGYEENLHYVRNLFKSPYKAENDIFNQISDKIYAAAITYDELVARFYSNCQQRHKDFFAIWDFYEKSRNSTCSN